MACQAARPAHPALPQPRGGGATPMITTATARGGRLLLLLLAAVALVGGARAGATCPCIQRENVRVVAITHGAVEGSSFWAQVRAGITAAGKHMNVQVEHRAPTKTQLVSGAGMKATLEALYAQALAEKPDGVILSIPDNAIVKPALEKFAAGELLLLLPVAAAAATAALHLAAAAAPALGAPRALRRAPAVLLARLLAHLLLALLQPASPSCPSTRG